MPGGGKTRTSFRPVISLEIKNEIVENLSNGINRKLIADKYGVSQTLITDVKQSMPLFCYNFNRKINE